MKISNSKFKILNFKGFTLMELLISIGLFATITVVVISVLFVSFRASKKAEAIIAMKQSGNLVLGRIVNNIRFARSLDDPPSCVPSVNNLNSITISDFHNYQTVYSCPDPYTGTTSISSNSASLLDTTAFTVANCSFSCTQATPSDPPIVKIQFTLSAANAADTVETSSSIPFQTSVILRNFSR